MLPNTFVLLALAALVAPIAGSPVDQAIVFGSETPSGAAAVNGLADRNVPYIAHDTTSSLASTSLPLYAGSTANFSMIILGSGTIGFSAAQWKQLYDYQELNGARLVSLYDSVGLGLSASYMAAANTTSRVLAPVGTVATVSAGLPASYSLRVSNEMPAVASPVLTFEAGVVGAAIYTISPNRQQLSFFYQITTSDVAVGGLSQSTLEILISWVSKGSFWFQE
ncbi:hypothetical protein BDR26DRAFT_932699 [Obelidium mucronatum]|nr:hypothetical protein BDR26DRAFT_932699 [Obelidium mucronatum]